MTATIRIVALAVVAALAAAAILTPVQPVPTAEVAPNPAAAPYAVCPLGDAARGTTALSMVGGEGGELALRVFSAGEIVVDEVIDMPAPVSGSVELNEFTGLARAPVLASLPDPAMAVESTFTGAGEAASVCDAGSPSTVILPGGTTAEGESYSVVLANPFSGSATVSIGAASEVGTESDPGLAGVIVPPRSIVEVDISALLPGRQSMSTSVTPIVGRVVAASAQEGAGDLAAVAGVEPSGDWFLPVPAVRASRSLVLATAGTADVPFQLDVYGPDGLVEAAYENTVPARGQFSIRVGELVEEEGALRVVAAAPVAAALRLAGDGTRAVVPGVSRLSPSWLLPGAGRLGPSTAYLFNPGEIEVEADILSGNGRRVLTSVTVPGGTMVGVEVSTAHAARIEADGDLAVTWLTVVEAGVAGDAAVPSFP
ncbi:MAG TPA: DUF5719 family protein [Acidimicrobiia bacterium]|nr:DUF5719 family protein [Acidimicrobiia bacterium]